MSRRTVATRWSVLTVGVGIALVTLALVSFAFTDAALAALTPGVIGIALCGVGSVCPPRQGPSRLVMGMAVVLALSSALAVTAAIAGSSAALGVDRDRYGAFVTVNVVMLVVLVGYLAVCGQPRTGSTTADDVPTLPDRLSSRRDPVHRR